MIELFLVAATLWLVNVYRRRRGLHTAHLSADDPTGCESGSQKTSQSTAASQFDSSFPQAAE
jgi:hypothetical protein